MPEGWHQTCIAIAIASSLPTILFRIKKISVANRLFTIVIGAFWAWLVPVLLLLLYIIIIYTGKNYTYAQAKIKVFAHNTVYCVKAASCCFLLFQRGVGK